MELIEGVSHWHNARAQCWKKRVGLLVCVANVLMNFGAATPSQQLLLCRSWGGRKLS